MKSFGERLKAFRQAADLSQRQVHTATGIGQSHITKAELGQVNISISHVSLFAELFGVKDYEMLQYNGPVPDPSTLKKNITKFLKSRNIDVVTFFKESKGPTVIIGDKVMESKFLSTPKLTSEIVSYCKEKFDAEFTTSQASKVLNGLYKAGLLERISTDAKTRFRYRKV